MTDTPILGTTTASAPTTHPIPDEALNSHIGIIGKVGAGKSYTAKGLVERLLHLNRHVVIIDPTGAWYGLRTGFEIPIFGGRHGDVEIGDKAGEAVAAVIVEQRTSAIIDLSLMTGGGQQRFMRTFAHRLRQKPLGALYLVIDEADEFLPQNVPHDQTNAYGDLKWMVRRGRLSGFRVMMITQRPAEIAKAVLTQIETLIAHRLTAPQDRKAIEEWVKGHHDPTEAKEVLSSLASLEKGTAWVWAPDLNILKRSAMPAIETFDSSRTPEPGEREVAPPRLEALDLSAIKEALAVAEEPVATKGGKADAGEVARLKERIRALESENHVLEVERDQWKACAETRGVLIQRARTALQANGDEIPAPSGGDPAPLPRREERAAPPKAPRPASGAAPARADGEGAEPLNQTARAVASLLKAIAPDSMTWEDALLLIGRRPGSGDAGKARKALADNDLATFGDGVRATEKLCSDPSIEVGHWPGADELVELWAVKLRGPGGDILTDLWKNGPATREEVGRRIGKAHTSGWFGKGMKDVTRSNLVHTSGGKLVLHGMLERD